MKKYRITGHYIEARINEIEVIRETEKYVYFENKIHNEVKESKDSIWSKYFDTWEDAHKELIAKSKNEIDNLSNRLKIANDTYSEIMSMKNEQKI